MADLPAHIWACRSAIFQQLKQNIMLETPRQWLGLTCGQDHWTRSHIWHSLCLIPFFPERNRTGGKKTEYTPAVHTELSGSSVSPPFSDYECSLGFQNVATVLKPLPYPQPPFSQPQMGFSFHLSCCFYFSSSWPLDYVETCSPRQLFTKK